MFGAAAIVSVSMGIYGIARFDRRYSVGYSLDVTRASYTPPTPFSQQQSDWTAPSGVTHILHQPSSFPGTWGSIGGTLSSQADLSAALALKFDSSSFTQANIVSQLGFTPYNGVANPLGFLTISSAASTYYPISGNPSAFLTGITSGQVTGALGFTPYSAANPNSYITASALTGYQLTSGLGTAAFTASSAYATAAQGTLAGTALQAGSLSGYLTSSAAASAYYPLANPSGYISSVPAQAWSTITGKPATLSGYGITDAYPLSGNPSSFLTAITSGQVVAALGYTPAQQLFSSYQANVTQSGTSSPTGTQLANSFAGGVTFAWARTGVGTYTITASSAVFAANKAKVFFGPLNNALAYVSYANTSTTVITVNTYTTSIVSLLLTTGLSDGVFTNTPVEVRVYP